MNDIQGIYSGYASRINSIAALLSLPHHLSVLNTVQYSFILQHFHQPLISLITPTHCASSITTQHLSLHRHTALLPSPLIPLSHCNPTLIPSPHFTMTLRHFYHPSTPFITSSSFATSNNRQHTSLHRHSSPLPSPLNTPYHTVTLRHFHHPSTPLITPSHCSTSITR